jgi:hypothetical protein
MYLPGAAAGALTPLGDLHNYQPPADPFTPTFEMVEEGLNGQAIACGNLAATAAAASPGNLEEEAPQAAEVQAEIAGPELAEAQVAGVNAARAVACHKVALDAAPASKPCLTQLGGEGAGKTEPAKVGNAVPEALGTAVKVAVIAAHAKSIPEAGQNPCENGAMLVAVCQRDLTAARKPSGVLDQVEQGCLRNTEAACLEDRFCKTGLLSQGELTKVTGSGLGASEPGEGAQDSGIAGNGVFDEATQQYCIYTRRR